MITLNEGTITLLIFALSVAFAAGAYVMSTRLARKQINGLGARVNRVADHADERMDRIALALVHICPPEEREKLIAILLDKSAAVLVKNHGASH